MNALSKSLARVSAGEMDVIQEILNVVDERGKAMDAKWGLGRLPSLVPIEWAERFASQKSKMSAAVWSWDMTEIRKHGEAMVRAYAKLDELATAAGHVPASPEVWEFMAGEELVLLVRDRQRMNQVDRQGRRCQVWSLDEVAEVIRKHPEIVIAKDAFPGAELVSIRPVKQVRDELNDSLEGLPL